MALILIINVFAHKRIQQTFSASMFRVHKCACVIIPRGSINEYTYENGVQFEIKSL